MKNVVCVIVFIICASQGLFAQKIEVKRFVELSEIQMVSTQRVDVNGVICALVRVVVPSNEGVLFQGNVIGETVYKGNEYLVYMSEGSRFLRIHYPNCETLMIDFTRYGYEGLKSKRVYELVLTLLEQEPLLLPVVGGRESSGRREDKLQLYTYSEENWSEGRLAVRLKGCGSNCKYGFIDSDANLVIPCLFDTVANFSEGLCSVRMGENYGFIDTLGNMVIEPQYGFANSFKNGQAAVFTKENKYESIIIDKQGSMVGDLCFRPQYLSTQDFYEYVKILYTKEEHKKIFDALKAYAKTCTEIINDDRIVQIVYLLGCYYYIEGLATHQDSLYKFAIDCWSKISTYDTNSLYMLGECLFYGRGCKQDFDKAFANYQIAAENNKGAQLRIGMYYYHGIGMIRKDYEKAILCFNACAELSDAMTYLGRYYSNVKKDIAESIKWYEKAANQENPAAMVYLGNMYYYGLGGLEMNKAKGLVLWNKAAESDNATALVNIGNYYYDGNEIQNALEYWSRAADLGSSKAADYLTEYYKNPLEGDNSEKATAWAIVQKNNEEKEKNLPFLPIYDCTFVMRNYEKGLSD